MKNHPLLELWMIKNNSKIKGMATKENFEEQNASEASDQAANTEAEGTERIDAIKKLIFGENMLEYDHKFKDLFEKLEDYHKEFEARLISVNQKLVEDMHDMKRKFENRVELLQLEINNHLAKIEDDKTDRREFGKMLQSIADNLMK